MMAKAELSMADIEFQVASSPKISSGRGNVQLRDPVTAELILIPCPSEDPRDPLNW